MILYDFLKSNFAYIYINISISEKIQFNIIPIIAFSFNPLRLTNMMLYEMSFMRSLVTSPCYSPIYNPAGHT